MTITLGAPPETLWQRLATIQRAVLMLDYDGTLAPFHEDPAQAVPYPDVEPLLKEIAALPHDRLILISGRALDDLENLVSLPRVVEYWGSHGRERGLPDGSRESMPIPDTAAAALDTAGNWRALIESAGGRFERKPTSIAFHWRALNHDERHRLRAQLTADLAAIDPAGELLFWHDFDGGMELRVRGVDKGTAVRRILAETSGHHAGSALLAYLGDDLTDEDAFDALGDQGFSILVREQVRPTAARSWLRPPDELIRFLRRWLDLRGRYAAQAVP